MATGPTTSVSGQRFSPDPLFQRVIEVALSDIEIDPVAAMSTLSKIMNFDRRDLEWLMDFIANGNEPLGEYLDYTICYLNREQFARFVQRVENHYTALMGLPGMHTHEAWELLIGYHAGDPGETPEQTRAVLLVNATVLDSLTSYKYFPLETVRNVITHCKYSSDFDDASPGYEWSLKELSPEMISFVISRLPDITRILELIRAEYLWHADYLAMRLDGQLPADADDTEAEAIRKVMLAAIDNSHVYPNWDQNSVAEERRDCRGRVEEAFDHHDIDSLRVYRNHQDEFLSNCALTDRVIKSLRLAGNSETAPILTSQHFKVCLTVDAALSVQPSTSRSGTSRVAVRSVLLNNVDKIENLVDDLESVTHVVVNHGVTDWDNITAVRREMENIAPSLRDGVL